MWLEEHVLSMISSFLLKLLKFLFFIPFFLPPLTKFGEYPDKMN